VNGIKKSGALSFERFRQLFNVKDNEPFRFAFGPISSIARLTPHRSSQSYTPSAGNMSSTTESSNMDSITGTF
jgi:hypothetical protein